MIGAERSQFLKFVIAGGAAATANFSSRILLGRFLNYVPSIILAYVVGMVTAFALNRLFVFEKPANSTGSQIFWFIVINLFAVLQTIVISVLLARYVLPAAGWVWRPELVAHAVGVIVPVFSSFIGHRILTFKSA